MGGMMSETLQKNTSPANHKEVAALGDYFKLWREAATQIAIRAAPAVAEWQEMVRQVAEQAAPVLRTAEAIQRSMEPIFEAQRTLHKVLAAEQRRWAVELEELLRSPALEQLQRGLTTLPGRTRRALLVLGDNGWFLHFAMSLPALWDLERELSGGNVKEAESQLIEHFRGRLDEIEESVVEKFPQRAPIIRAALNAHRRQEYALSIPVLLAQADGMCKQQVNQHLFMNRNKRPMTAIYVEQVAADTFEAALLTPLAQTLPISTSSHERSKDDGALNRHAVLHGESLDYGSETNGLKAVSLINYVAHVLGDLQNSPSPGVSAPAHARPRGPERK